MFLSRFLASTTPSFSSHFLKYPGIRLFTTSHSLRFDWRLLTEDASEFSEMRTTLTKLNEISPHASRPIIQPNFAELEKLNDAAIVEKFKAEYQQRLEELNRNAESQATADLGNMTNYIQEIDNNISYLDEIVEVAIGPYLQKLEKQSALDEKEKTEAPSWNFYDYVNAYPGLIEEYRWEWMHGKTTLSDAEERFLESDNEEFRKALYNGDISKLHLDPEVPKFVGFWNLPDEIRKNAKLVAETMSIASARLLAKKAAGHPDTSSNPDLLASLITRRLQVMANINAKVQKYLEIIGGEEDPDNFALLEHLKQCQREQGIALIDADHQDRLFRVLDPWKDLKSTQLEDTVKQLGSTEEGLRQIGESQLADEISEYTSILSQKDEKTRSELVRQKIISVAGSSPKYLFEPDDEEVQAA